MNKKRKGQALALMLVSILAVSHLQAVDASTVNKAKNKKEQAEQELNQTKKQIEAIEKQQSALRSEIDEKDAELVNLLVNIGILEEELDAKNVQLAQVTEELAQAQQKSADQYEAMKKRIQFMYERGDTAMIETLLGSADMTDFLNKVEYVSDVYEYDRNLLTQYQITVQQVADLKVNVETEKAELEAMQEEYAAQQSSLETILAQKREQMGSYDNQLVTAQAKADEFKQTIAAQNEIIKEEELKQLEAAKAAEAAAKARAAKNHAGNSSGGSNSSGNSSNTANNGSQGSGSSGGSSSGSGGGANPGYATNVSGGSVVSYACQFVGNPYVWGGTSLTQGADCSGFVMSVFAHFGISLPHSSAALQGCGKEVSYANAQPGDLICYSGHVGIYMGGGMIVHAQSAAVGITTSSAAYRTIVTVRRVL